MANEKRQSGKSNAFGGYRFIGTYLNKDDKERLAAMDCATEFPLADALRLVTGSYKLSFSKDAKNDTYICSLTDTDPKSETHKCILSGRGSTPTTAWYGVAYRHFVLANGDWTTLDVPGDSERGEIW